MAQKRTFEWEADDSTFAINNRLLEIVQAGVYCGFDAGVLSGLNLNIVHTDTGVSTVTEDELDSAKKGVFVTKQGVAVKEDSQLIIPVAVGNSLPRIDILVSEHIYTEITGGRPAIYLIIKGTPATEPVAPALTNPKRQTIIGYLNVPENMSGLDDPQFSYVRAKRPEFAGEDFLSRIEDLEQSTNDNLDLINTKLSKDSNLEDLQSASAARGNLNLGNHVTHNYAGQGGNLGNANTISRGDHLHNNVYEPVFSKNTAFNVNFGTSGGEACEGNDLRLSDSRKCNNTFDSASTSRTNLGLGNHTTHNYAGSGDNYGTNNSVSRGDHKHAASEITSGVFATSLIPNLSYQKITSGYVNLYQNLRTSGKYITRSGTTGGIYLRQNNNVAIGGNGLDDYMLYVNGNMWIRDLDIANGTTDGYNHIIQGLGAYGDFPAVARVVSALSRDEGIGSVGLSVQMPAWNSPAGRFKFVDFLDAFGGTAGYIGNSVLLSEGPGIEIWGLNDTHTPSDKRIKDKIEDSESVLDKFTKTRVVNFNYKKTKEKRIGFIAQELYDIFPELVDNTDIKNHEKSLKEGDKDFEYWSISYHKMIPMLVKAIQELNDKINL